MFLNLGKSYRIDDKVGDPLRSGGVPKPELHVGLPFRLYHYQPGTQQQRYVSQHDVDAPISDQLFMHFCLSRNKTRPSAAFWTSRFVPWSSGQGVLAKQPTMLVFTQGLASITAISGHSSD